MGSPIRREGSWREGANATAAHTLPIRATVAVKLKGHNDPQVEVVTPPNASHEAPSQAARYGISSCRHRIFPSVSLNQAAFSEPKTQTCSTVLKPGRS